MASRSIAQRLSLVNRGTGLGLIIGLALGLLAAAAFIPSPAPTNTSSTQTARQPASARSKTLAHLRVALITEQALLADAVRAAGAGQDFRPAVAALDKQQQTSAEVLNRMFSKVISAKVVENRNALSQKLMDYATKLRTKQPSPAADLEQSSGLLTLIADTLASSNPTYNRQSILTQLRREYEAMKMVVELSNAGKISESYTRQQQASQATATLADLLDR